MKKRMITLWAVILLFPVLFSLFQSMAYALDTVWFKDVSAGADPATKQATVAGKVASGEGQLVTLKVIDPNGAYFLDSVRSTSQGRFVFQWNVSVEGKYQVQIGVENSRDPYQTGFTYHQPASTPGTPTPTPTPTATATPTPTSTPTPTLTATQTSPPGTSGASEPSAQSDSGIQLVNDEQLVVDKEKGCAAIQVETDKKEVRMSASLVEHLLQSNAGLTLESERFTLNLKAATLRQLVDASAAEGLSNVYVAFRFVETPAEETSSVLAKAEQLYGVSLQASSALYEFEVLLVGEDGKSVEVSKFDEPIALKLKVTDNDPRKLKLAGLYYISDNGELEYMGSLKAGNAICGNMNHFSKYAVLDYRRTFADVPADSWAYDVITEMAAKHIVDGVSRTEFAPERSVTRAEFAALLVRALGLSGGKAAFEDVTGDKWYEGAVAAAYSAGIVQGTGEKMFQPERTISREEMAAMLVRAWTRGHPNDKPGATATLDFADKAAISGWAEEAVSRARELGLLSGRSDAEFAPQGVTTRAEAAQAIANLIK